MAPQVDENLRDCLTELEAALDSPAKDKKALSEAPIERICKVADREGLSQDVLDSLIDILIKPNALVQPSIDKIVKSLYPARSVSDSAVVKIVGCLGHGASKPSAQAQVTLLHWLIMVYDVLESRTVISRLYGALFNMLDMISLRKWLCHLLAITTRRKHVRPFRIQALLELLRSTGSGASLLGLLAVYKDYCPDIIAGTGVSTKPAAFPHPDPDWRAHLLAIQDSFVSQNGQALEGQTDFRVIRHGAKRIKADLVPKIQTVRAAETSMALEGVDNVDDLIEKLERLELPSQTVSVLGDPLIQRYLSMRPSDSASKRIQNWLATYFEEALESMHAGQSDPESLEGILGEVLKYSACAKVLPPACEAFLRFYLSDWDGATYKKIILDLVAFLSIRPFKEFQAQYLNPVEAAILDGDAASKTVLLEVYTAMLQNWTIQASTKSLTPPKDRAAETPSTTCARFARHVDTLCLSLLESAESPRVQASSAVLEFYERLAASPGLTKPNKGTQLPVILPSLPIIRHCLFTSSLSIISRLCLLIATYKRALDSHKSSKPGSTSSKAGKRPPPSDIPSETVERFNHLARVVWDFVCRDSISLHDNGPSSSSSSSPTTSLPIPSRIISALESYGEQSGYGLASLFSPSHRSALCALSEQFLRELESDERFVRPKEYVASHARAPVTSASLAASLKHDGMELPWDFYREQFFQIIAIQGFTGPQELLKVFGEEGPGRK